METVSESVEIVNPTSTRVINKLDELNRIRERISTLKTDMENNVPHAEFWYKIMLNQESVITECNHEFCAACFETWKKTRTVLNLTNPNRIVNCPCCRAICSRVKAYKA